MAPLAQIKRALSWCDPKVEPLEIRRLAGVLLLREMAEAAPAVFNVHVKGFIDAIWHPLRDPRLNVREAAVAALKVRIHVRCTAIPHQEAAHPHTYACVTHVCDAQLGLAQFAIPNSMCEHQSDVRGHPLYCTHVFPLINPSPTVPTPRS